MDDEVEAGEFCLQYCYGRVQSNEDKNITFHTAYTGPNTFCTIRHLKTNTPYSFRVCSRPEGEEKWSIWSVPRTAHTTIPHYRECSSLHAARSRRVSSIFLELLWISLWSYFNEISYSSKKNVAQQMMLSRLLFTNVFHHCMKLLILPYPQYLI